MSERKDGGPAYPHDHLKTAVDMYGREVNTGMSLRDWFAGQALAGMLAWDGYAAPTSETKPTAEIFADSAYELADAMLAARGD